MKPSWIFDWPLAIWFKAFDISGTLDEISSPPAKDFPRPLSKAFNPFSISEIPELNLSKSFITVSFLLFKVFIKTFNAPMLSLIALISGVLLKVPCKLVELLFKLLISSENFLKFSSFKTSGCDFEYSLKWEFNDERDSLSLLVSTLTEFGLPVKEPILFKLSRTSLAELTIAL